VISAFGFATRNDKRADQRKHDGESSQQGHQYRGAADPFVYLHIDLAGARLV
jgi:hypothetical protein